MVVRGEGEPVPHTTLHKWPVQDIIATLEVKKSLYSGELAESYIQMRDVLRVFGNWVQSAPRDKTLNLNANFRAYAEVTGRAAPAADKRGGTSRKEDSSSSGPAYDLGRPGGAHPNCAWL
jgi:hypothetical protein